MLPHSIKLNSVLGHSKAAAWVRARTPVRAAKETPPSSDKKIKLERGFRWDPALQRWIEEKRLEGQEFYEKDMTIKTKTGDEYTVWPMVHSYLVSKDLKSVKCSEIADLVEKGYTLLDVRLEKDYQKAHSKGFINVPLFRPVTRNDAWNQAKKIISAFMVMTPTERNPNFVKDVAKAAPEKSKIIVMCNRGGTLETVITTTGLKPKSCKDPDRAFGRETRSLKAIFELFQDGFTDLFYVEGGIGQWQYEGREMEST